MDIFGFLHWSIVDIIDILAVAVIIYLCFTWIRGSAAGSIFTAVVMLFLAEVIASALDMKMLSKLLGTVLDLGAIALIIIFQPEIRHFLIKFGSNSVLGRKSKQLLDRIFGIKDHGVGTVAKEEVLDAVKAMADSKTGALIVISHKDRLDAIIETGDTIDSLIQSRLIQGIFFKNSPLHDGAVVLRTDRIVAARCTLPITQRTDLPAHYGMRHKAAIGLSEECDAQIIVVSEETGHISLAQGGEIIPVGSIKELSPLLSADRDREEK